MPRQAVDSRAHREAGTASVELVAVIPFLLLAVLAAAQLAFVGDALWSAGVAARAASRATLVGGNPRKAALQALPASLRQGAETSEDEDGSVEVRVRMPRMLAGLPPLMVGAKTTLGDIDG